MVALGAPAGAMAASARCGRAGGLTCASGTARAVPAPCGRAAPAVSRSSMVAVRQPVRVGSMRSTRSRQGAVMPARAHAETAEESSVDVSACPPLKEPIGLDALSAVDLRVGVIEDAKQIEDPEASQRRGKPTMSRTYLRLLVDIGLEKRVIISEMRFVWDVEDAIGKKVLVAANCRPRTVLGVESHGEVIFGVNFDPTPMPRTFKVIPPGLGRLPPGSQLSPAHTPR